MDQGRDFDSDPAGDRNFCRQLCMWEENGESTRRRVAGRNEDHADPLQKSRLLQIRLTAAVMLLEIQQMKKLRPVVEINFTETAL